MRKVFLLALCLTVSTGLAEAKTRASEPLKSRSLLNTADCGGAHYNPPQAIEEEAEAQASVTARQNTPAGYELEDARPKTHAFFGCFPDASPDGRVSSPGFFNDATAWIAQVEAGGGSYLYVAIPHASGQEFRQLPSKEADDALHLNVYGRRGAAALLLNPAVGRANVVYNGVNGVRDMGTVGEEAQGVELWAFALRARTTERDTLVIVHNDTTTVRLQPIVEKCCGVSDLWIGPTARWGRVNVPGRFYVEAPIAGALVEKGRVALWAATGDTPGRGLHERRIRSTGMELRLWTPLWIGGGYTSARLVEPVSNMFTHRARGFYGDLELRPAWTSPFGLPVKLRAELSAGIGRWEVQDPSQLQSYWSWGQTYNAGLTILF